MLFRSYELGENESHLCFRVSGDYDAIRQYHKENGWVCFENSMELIEQLKESGCTYSLVKQLAKFTVGIRSYDFKQLKEKSASEKIVLDSKKAYSNRFHTNGGNEAYSVMAHTLRDIYGTDVLIATGNSFTGSVRKAGYTEKMAGNRSEERRVGKECRSRWSPYH